MKVNGCVDHFTYLGLHSRVPVCWMTTLTTESVWPRLLLAAFDREFFSAGTSTHRARSTQGSLHLNSFPRAGAAWTLYRSHVRKLEAVHVVSARHSERPPFSAISSSDNLRLGLGLGSVVWLWQYQELFPATTLNDDFQNGAPFGMAVLQNGGSEPFTPAVFSAF